MRKHNGMRPQDIAVLARIILMGDMNWQMLDLSKALFISPSEISESLNRSRIARLIDSNKRKVNAISFFEFLQYGVQYVFPQIPGTLVKGIPTAHSHPFMKNTFHSTLNYVWPDPQGKTLGLLIEPFYPKQILAIKESSEYYKLLALIDVIRIGKTREVKVALSELRNIIIDESPYIY